MQDHYAGDIGDYVKIALLRKVGTKRRVGVAWYLHPDEPRDGGHTDYLDNPDHWRRLDCCLFDALRQIVNNRRSTKALEDAGILNATFSREMLACVAQNANERETWRKRWFERVLCNLKKCDLVFADPDNGLADNRPNLRRRKSFGKRIPLCEIEALAKGRTVIVYHHNTRFPGGHEAEIRYWQRHLGNGVFAVRARAYSCRTFFIVNGDEMTRNLTVAFCREWSGHRVGFVDCLN